MEGIISASVSSFSNFLSEKNSLIKNSTNSIISFVINGDFFHLENKIDPLIKGFERSFYFEKPSSDFLLIGINEAIVIAENGDQRFAVTSKKIKEIKGNFINNWDTFPNEIFPLFLGGMKFYVEHEDDEWKDFNDSAWFIPEILYLKNKGKSYLFFNQYLSSAVSKDALAEKFKKKLSNFLSITSVNEEKEKIQLRHITGNSPKDKKKWKTQVNQALEKISENVFQKIVLCRKVEILLSGEPSLNSAIDSFRKNYSDCYLFIYHHGKSSFFGATPEKLAKFQNHKIEIDAIAGSAARGISPEEDKQYEKELKSSKNLNEHKIVIDFIKENLSAHSSSINIEREYSIKKLTNIQHLWSTITAELNSTHSPFNLLNDIFPTPAVSGYPQDSALQFIKKTETHKRGLYSGIIGWFNFNNEGEFVVAIRSALTTANKVFAYAGNGIVENSDPELEYKETELKLKTILSLFDYNENKN